jgi:hypothetical protein
MRRLDGLGEVILGEFKTITSSFRGVVADLQIRYKERVTRSRILSQYTSD